HPGIPRHIAQRGSGLVGQRMVASTEHNYVIIGQRLLNQVAYLVVAYNANDQVHHAILELLYQVLPISLRHFETRGGMGLDEPGNRGWDDEWPGDRHGTDGNRHHPRVV